MADSDRKNDDVSALSRIYAWFSAIISDDRTLLQDLLTHGLPVDTQHPLRHSTALMEATRLGRTQTVQWLLDQGAAPAFLCGLPPRTPLHSALRHHRWDIATILIHTMPNCTVLDAQQASPLHILCAESHKPTADSTVLNIAAMLLTKNCPLNAIDREGTTALHHCVINGHYGLAELLLTHGANPNAQIPASWVTPLTIAALEKDKQMAALLLSHGADASLQTRDGATPLSLYPQLRQLLPPSATIASGHAPPPELHSVN